MRVHGRRRHVTQAEISIEPRPYAIGIRTQLEDLPSTPRIRCQEQKP